MAQGYRSGGVASEVRISSAGASREAAPFLYCIGNAGGRSFPIGGGIAVLQLIKRRALACSTVWRRSIAEDLASNAQRPFMRSHNPSSRNQHCK
jgi:hypothetical protein